MAVVQLAHVFKEGYLIPHALLASEEVIPFKASGINILRPDGQTNTHTHTHKTRQGKARQGKAR